MQEDEKIIKQKKERVGQVEQSTIYATDLESLKYAIEQVKNASYGHGYKSHKAESIGFESFVLEKRVKDLEKELEETKASFHRGAGALEVTRDLSNKYFIELGKIKIEFNNFKAMHKQAMIDFSEQLRRKKIILTSLKGQVTKLTKQLIKKQTILKL